MQLHELVEMRLQAYESSRRYEEKVKSYHDKKLYRETSNKAIWFFYSIPSWDFSLENWIQSGPTHFSLKK